MLREQRAEAEELYEARAVRLESMLEEWKTKHAALRRRFSLETEGFRRDADNIGRHEMAWGTRKEETFYSCTIILVLLVSVKVVGPSPSPESGLFLSRSPLLMTDAQYYCGAYQTDSFPPQAPFHPSTSASSINQSTNRREFTSFVLSFSRVRAVPPVERPAMGYETHLAVRSSPPRIIPSPLLVVPTLYDHRGACLLFSREDYDYVVMADLSYRENMLSEQKGVQQCLPHVPVALFTPQAVRNPDAKKEPRHV